MVFNILFSLIFHLLTFVHPYYVSVTEMNYNKKNKSLEVTNKIFTDDFEKTLIQNYHTKIDLINPTDKSAVEKLMAAYLKKNLKIAINGKPAEMKFIGYEIEEDAVWCYSETLAPTQPSVLKIENTILYDYKKEQVNLIHVTVNGQRKSNKLQQPETVIETHFQF